MDKNVLLQFTSLPLLAEPYRRWSKWNSTEMGFRIL